MPQEAIRRAIALADSLGGDDADTIMALVEMPAGQCWKDISSAPKDGSDILLWAHFRHDQPDGHIIGRWFDPGQRHMGWWVSAALRVFPKLWQPLPKPPHQPQ